jgi:hypothetical protein
MDRLSPADLAELFHLRETVIDTQFQFWITVTFAVIVASFVGGDYLSRRLRSVMAVLYGLSVVVFVSRWLYVAMDASLLRARLVELGIPATFPWVAVVSRVVLIALGTVAALVFLLSKRLRGTP